MANSYRVTWEIDVEADTPMDAAIAAMRMQSEHTTANEFTVVEVCTVTRGARDLGCTIDHKGLHEPVKIDLGDEPRHLLPEYEEDEPAVSGTGEDFSEPTTTPDGDAAPTIAQHILSGNCWKNAYDCADCRTGNLCDVCHEHDEPRGDCSECPNCEACDGQ